MRRDIFQAIADPTRREIIQLLVAEKLNLSAVAEQFNISRPAISKHMKILHECGIVDYEKIGRERYCKAKVEQLDEVAEWLIQLKTIWEARLDSLEDYLKKMEDE
jgi:DNA-binding transcriptional ArsR family regulator